MARTPLIVVALKEEAAYLDGRHPVLVTGVGKVAAAIAVTRALATGELPSEIINVGTAGALQEGFAGTQEIEAVSQHDFDSPAIEALTGLAYGPPISVRAVGLVLATRDVFVSDPVLRENSPNGPTLSVIRRAPARSEVGRPRRMSAPVP